jgi:hypothetical protein
MKRLLLSISCLLCITLHSMDDAEKSRLKKQAYEYFEAKYCKNMDFDLGNLKYNFNTLWPAWQDKKVNPSVVFTMLQEDNNFKIIGGYKPAQWYLALLPKHYTSFDTIFKTELAKTKNVTSAWEVVKTSLFSTLTQEIENHKKELLKPYQQ